MTDLEVLYISKLSIFADLFWEVLPSGQRGIVFPSGMIELFLVETGVWRMTLLLQG